uniref:CS domain-containing protein n=1 Tax=Chromera velia CCMP2878 TaxID=1169474 RepID=A0A0G4HSK4_9ALVE|eukprot:Cvel_8303.t1-p1 / transcript=Cvel_8303.t1 / gene=Cvel_8303 / organism=Chromera_velia_CCMP2878 / gene_product=Calcyclin-binding protein, putative / transcript_product=Calcyclin-binding protein, putative / location=Cvel_scaffold456:21950-25210(+) / protein_length=264 / sequence_SO=supercontig / SO=protein_coding / is_pseudo=false
MRVYVHFDEQGETPPFTLPVFVKDEALMVGTLKQSFLKEHGSRLGSSLKYEDFVLCLPGEIPLRDKAFVASSIEDYGDVFVRPLEKVCSNSSALQSNLKSRGELSYYYAHASKHYIASTPTPSNANTLSVGSSSRAPAPSPAPAPTAAGGPVPSASSGLRFTALKQYSWEDEKNKVKVLLPLEGVGSLDPSLVRCSFQKRSLELSVEDLKGKNYRFAVPLLQGEIDETKSSYSVKANRIVLFLRKANAEDHWFSLFKSKAIGED